MTKLPTAGSLKRLLSLSEPSEDWHGGRVRESIGGPPGKQHVYVKGSSQQRRYARCQANNDSARSANHVEPACTESCKSSKLMMCLASHSTHVLPQKPMMSPDRSNSMHATMHASSRRRHAGCAVERCCVHTARAAVPEHDISCCARGVKRTDLSSVCPCATQAPRVRGIVVSHQRSSEPGQSNSHSHGSLLRLQRDARRF